MQYSGKKKGGNCDEKISFDDVGVDFYSGVGVCQHTHKTD
jgi:hypothetical protein